MARSPANSRLIRKFQDFSRPHIITAGFSRVNPLLGRKPLFFFILRIIGLKQARSVREKRAGMPRYQWRGRLARGYEVARNERVSR